MYTKKLRNDPDSHKHSIYAVSHFLDSAIFLQTSAL